LALGNFGLGLACLAMLAEHRPWGLVDLLAGAFCCAVGGCLVGAAIARAVWRAAAVRQARRWRRLFELLLMVTESTSLSASELGDLKDDAERLLQSGG
jgi:hypothetical protein